MEDVYQVVVSLNHNSWFDVKGPGGTVGTFLPRLDANSLAFKLNSAFAAGYLLRMQEEEQKHPAKYIEYERGHYKRGSDGFIMES